MIKYKVIVRPECMEVDLVPGNNVILCDDYNFGVHGELILHKWINLEWQEQEVSWVFAPGMWLSVQRIEVEDSIDAIVEKNIEES